MALAQLLNPIQVMSMDDDSEHIELPKPAYANLGKDVLRGIIRSNINNSLERLRSNNIDIGLEPN